MKKVTYQEMGLLICSQNASALVYALFLNGLFTRINTYTKGGQRYALSFLIFLSVGLSQQLLALAIEDGQSSLQLLNKRYDPGSSIDIDSLLFLD